MPVYIYKYVWRTIQIAVLLNLYDHLIDCMLLFPVAAGFDFRGSPTIATFTAYSTSTTVDVPIIADLNSDEGTEFFVVQLSIQSCNNQSDLPNVTPFRLGSVTQATIYIQEEIVLNFQDASVRVNEGADLTLTITASIASDQRFFCTVNITGNNNDSLCKLPTEV